MKRLSLYLSLLAMIFIACCGLLGFPQPTIATALSQQSGKILVVEAFKASVPDESCTIDKQKIDLNNAN